MYLLPKFTDFLHFAYLLCTSVSQITPGSYLYSMTAYLNFLHEGSPYTMKSGGVLVRGISERLIVEF